MDFRLGEAGNDEKPKDNWHASTVKTLLPILTDH